MKEMSVLSRQERSYLRFYHAVRRYSIQNARPGGLDGIKRVEDSMRGIIPSKTNIMIPKEAPRSRKKDAMVVDQKEEEQYITIQRQDVKTRIKELEAADAFRYPRISQADSAMSCHDFRSQYDILQNGQDHPDTVTLRGRIYSTRKAGSKLLFVDVIQDGYKVQGVLDLGRLKSRGVTDNMFKDAQRLLRRGDIVTITGSPKRESRGELSLLAATLPTLLTPALASLPATLNDPATLVKNRHADLLIHQNAFDTLKLRSHIIQFIRNYLLHEHFQEVQTPILARSAGGAVARPFATYSTEFPSKPLNLRIAPELWLKRLVIGGLDRVFEIGPVFRNEGIDGTHNPEFYTCEFYQAFASLDDLINKTEDLVRLLINSVKKLNLTTVPRMSQDGDLNSPWKRLEFIPTIQQALGSQLPDLQSASAFDDLVAIFKKRGLPLPTTPTLPRLLDRLCGQFIEPLTLHNPAFIIHHPAVLAPLSKSFTCPHTHQQVSARAELFINGKELANMYEEENNPIEQRRKFLEQRKFIDGTEGEVTGEVDEDYLRAMEWALPPTGGWGMGLERLVMYLAGRERIGDVCSFGTLRSVVGLGKVDS